MDPAALSAEDRLILDNLKSVVLSKSYSGYRVSNRKPQGFCTRVEDRLSQIYGGAYVTLTTSCTTGLELALRALGVGPCDRVIVPAYTMAGTASAVLACGAEPVFADVDPLTGLITPETIAEVLMDWEFALQPAAIIAVSVHGGVPAVAAMKRSFPHIPVVEDCAQAFCTRNHVTGYWAGLQGDIGVLSFKQGKVLSCGEGGALITKDESPHIRIQGLRNHGDVTSADQWGGNHHMTELQAAVLDARLTYILEKLHSTYQASRALARLVSSTTFVPMEVNGAPFIFWGLLHPKGSMPPGFTRSYHTPLCCVPWYKKNLKPGCFVAAHTFNTNMVWAPPPATQADVERMNLSIRTVQVNP